MIFICVRSYGETEGARITSGLSDGNVSVERSELAGPDFRVFREHRMDVPGHQVTMRQVEAPVFPKSVDLNPVLPESVATEEPGPTAAEEENAMEHHFFTVMATVYDRKKTRLQVQGHDGGGEQQGPVEAWSNVDWNHLGGFLSFEGRGRHFTFLLFATNQPISEENKTLRNEKEMLLVLPGYEETGARYLIMGDGEDTKAVEFLEAIHVLYEAEKESLVAAAAGRERKLREDRLQAERQRLHPPEPEKVEISFWNNDVNRSR